MFEHKVYLIEALTQTHVGSGDTTHGIVDLTIQKDPTTFLPVFHPSSIKGAVRDHFLQYLAGDNFQEKGGDKVKPFTFDAVFGAEDPEIHIRALEEKKKKSETVDPALAAAIERSRQLPQHGLVKFYEARLLTLPLRATRGVYRNATCPEAVLHYLETLHRFQIQGVPEEHQRILMKFFEKLRENLNRENGPEFYVFSPNQTTLSVEDFEGGATARIPSNGNGGDALWQGHPYTEVEAAASALLLPHGAGGPALPSLAVFQDDLFKEVCENGLPVVARNKLEKGTSENLFYEEVLPRRSVVWFMTGAHRIFSRDAEDTYKKAFGFFEQKLTTDMIQMGANASIGYGMTRLTALAKPDAAGQSGKGGEKHE